MRAAQACRRPLRALALPALAIAAVAATAAAAAVEPAPADFDLRVPLATEREDGLHALLLPENVLRAATTPQPYDLRIFNAAGEALPIAALPGVVPPEPVRAAPTPLRLVALPVMAQARDRALAEVALRFERDREHAVLEFRSVPEARAPAVSQPAEAGGYLVDLRGLQGRHGDLRLHFAADAPDYASAASIAGSEDLVNWRTLSAGPLTRNRQLGEPVERGTFEIGAAPAFARIQWPGAQAPRLDSASFVERLPAAAATLPRAVLEAAGADAAWLVDIPVGLPALRLILRAPQPNQALRVDLRCLYQPAQVHVRRHLLRELSASSEPPPWIACGHGIEVFRVDRAGTWIENPPIGMPGRPIRIELKVVDPKDYRGAPPAVEVEWVPVRLAFLARGPGPYQLAVGREGTQDGPRLDAAGLMPHEDPYGARLPLARVIDTPDAAASAAPSSSEGARRAARSQLRWRWMLWGVLALAVGTLAAMAWQLARRIGRTGTD